MNKRALLLFLLLSCSFKVDLHAQQKVKVIAGATLIDVAELKTIANSVIVIDGGRIVQAGPAAQTPIPQGVTKAETMDAAGKFVIPGLADMHNHLLTGSLGPPQNLKANLARLLAVGVTTAFDPSSSKADFSDLKNVVAQGNYPYPSFFGTGPVITVEGDRMGAEVGSPMPKSVEEANAAVKDLKAAGVDAVKIARDDLSWCSSVRMPLMKLDVLTALIKEAHAQGLRAFVHAPMLDRAKEALAAGADGLMHGIVDKRVDEEFIDLMKKNRAFYVPTLSLYEDVADIASWMRRQSGFDQRKLFPSSVYDLLGSPAAVGQFTSIFNNTKFTKDHLPTARANVKKVADAGIPVVLGTDTGFIGVMLGVSTQLELSLMVDAGLPPVDALRASTLEAAKMIGREKEIGVIEKDHLADMVVLDANPLEDIRNVRRIYRVIKGGVAYDPATR